MKSEILAFKTGYATLEFSASNDSIRFKDGLNGLESTLKLALDKVGNILKGSLDSIPSPSVKIQIMGGKICLRCKGKTLLYCLK